jgi:hypothetical protein
VQPAAKTQVRAAAKDAALTPPEHYFCGGDTVDVRSGGQYEPEPGMANVGFSVVAGGDCKVTLENCVIGGPSSVKLLNNATVVLRRCQVRGAVQLIGAPTLVLEETTLPKAPGIVGKGKVIRH